MAVTLCPIAITAGCRRCPIFSICPLKGVIGDQSPAAKKAPEPQSDSERGGGKKSAKRSRGGD